jgi:cytochrome oxidase Cu insertion factor (SCO1/SenC/PrrC family)
MSKEFSMGTTTRRANRYAGGAMARASIARAVMLVAYAIAAILVLGILLVVLKANPSNDIVQFVRDAAGTLAGPFDNLFTLDSNKAEKAVNWGLAAVVWVVLGKLIARLLLRR